MWRRVASTPTAASLCNASTIAEAFQLIANFRKPVCYISSFPLLSLCGRTSAAGALFRQPHLPPTGVASSASCFAFRLPHRPPFCAFGLPPQPPFSCWLPPQAPFCAFGWPPQPPFLCFRLPPHTPQTPFVFWLPPRHPVLAFTLFVFLWLPPWPPVFAVLVAS